MTERYYEDLRILLNVKFEVKVTGNGIGKYQESAHHECNLNLSLTKTIPIMFHSSANYGSHLIFKSLEDIISE